MTAIVRSIVIILLGVFLSGCVQKEILDDINLIECIGFDHSDEEDKINGTILFSIYQPDQPPKNTTINAKGRMKKTILQDMQLQSTNPIVTGSMELVLFGKELATKNGILDLVDPFQRDPGVGSGLHVALVDGEAKDLLEGEYGIKGNATFISDLIKNNIENEDLPRTNLQLFLKGYYSEGRTPFMPQLKQLSKDSIELNGIAFFRYGKIVETILPEQMFFFKLLVDKYSNGLHRVKIDGDEAAIRNIRSVHKFKLESRSPFEITVDIRVNGIINEFSGNRLTPKKIAELEQRFEDEITKECLKLISIFKDKEIDPIGFGHFIKTQDRNFDIDKWNEAQYQELIVKIHPKVKITEAGVIE